MHLTPVNVSAKGSLNTSDLRARFASAKLVGAGARCALTLAVLSVLLLMAVRPMQAQTKKVNAVDEVSAGGYKAVTTTDKSGSLPAKIKLPVDSTSMAFAIYGGTKTKGRCTAPCIAVNGGGNYNDADGVGSASSLTMQADQSISGIHAPVAAFLSGVFESGPPSGPAPATLDFSAIGTNFSSLSPVLQQVFFIGDGLTGDGSGDVQQFFVPNGAKFLYLGIPDACFYNGQPSCYGDNSGDFVVSYAISTVSGAPQIAKFLPAKGKVGSSVKIWGYNLLTVTGVSFNGLAATFTVESTFIDAVVPPGVTTGPIEVTTPMGTAQSKTVFTVKP